MEHEATLRRDDIAAVETNGMYAHEQSSSTHCLLDIDTELADELDARTLPAARAAAIAVTFRTEPGRLPLTKWLSRATPGPGVLVLDGVLVVDVMVGDRVAAELVGTGDLVQPTSRTFAELLSCGIACRALTPSRVALLDGDFAKRVRFWPQIYHVLLCRAARRAASLNVQRAIAAQPRLEVRLALMLWHLAARWGKVEPGGISLPMPLTHQLMGRLVGAERPSVSHALARLSHARLVTGHGDEWHLHGKLQDHLELMSRPARDRNSALMAQMGAFRPGSG
jgi:CRP/FNR family transcriptional regulator, cyclic AMP receptor protein